MESLKRITHADVYKNGVLAGKIVKDQVGVLSFTYVGEYSGAPVATTLPVNSASVTMPGGGLPSFFAGLLPEGHRLTVLRKAVKTSSDDELSLILAIGNDLPGDVQVVPEGTKPQEQKSLVMGDVRLQDFAALTSSVDGVGIAGVQAKASSSMVNAPVRIGGRHGILKIDPPEHPHLVANEAFHLRHARELGIPVAKHEVVHDQVGRPGLLVQRFDRSDAGQRWAMEDAAQLLNILPAKKYDVSAEDVVRAVQQTVNAPPVATRNLFMQFFYAWLTGNGDVHAKNISVLQSSSGKWKVSPVYDVPSTVFYRDMTMALPIAGKTKAIRARHWEDFCASIGLRRQVMQSAVKIVFDVVKQIDLSELPFEGSARYGAERELRFRSLETEKLLSS